MTTPAIGYVPIPDPAPAAAAAQPAAAGAIPDINYADFIFGVLESSVGAIEMGAQAIAGDLVGLILGSMILQVFFAIQLTILAFKFTLDGDYLESVSDFIKLVAIYIIVISVMRLWEDIGFGIIDFVTSLIIGAIGGAADGLAGMTGGRSLGLAGSEGPVQLITAMMPALEDVFTDIRRQAGAAVDTAREGVGWGQWLLAIVTARASGEADPITTAILLAILNLIAGLLLKAILLITVVILLIYIFAGWFKAMLGAAFAPIALMVVPIDKGRMASGALSFILSGIGAFAFSLAVGLIGLGMLIAGAQRMLTFVQQNSAALAAPDALNAGASMNLMLLLLMIGLSTMVLLIIFNAKSWGAEFFGGSAFSMESKSMRGAAASGARGAATADKAGAVAGGKALGKAWNAVTGGGSSGGGGGSAAPSGGGFTPITPVPNRGGSQGASGPGLAQGSAGARGLPSPGGGIRSSYGGGGGGAFRPSSKSRFNKNNVTDVVDKSKTKG